MQPHRRPKVAFLKRFWLDRPWLALLWVVIFALLMAAAQRGLALWRSSNTRLPGACWIWAPETGKDPSAFYAAQDFEISETLATHAAARLAIVADESYVVYLNGRFLGANSYGQDAAIDTYDVTGLIRGGRNRVVVELRSQRGVGGLLADLRVNSATTLDRVRPVLTSNSDWQIFRRHDERLFDLEQVLPRGESAVVWQLSPTGRWRLSGDFVQRPLPVAKKRPKRLAPWRMRNLHGDRWIDLKPPRRHRPRVGPKVIFDWGKTVNGFLFVDLPTQETAPALVYFSNDAPPDPQLDSPDHIMLPIAGVDQWRDIHPRSFRYVLFVGLEPLGRIDVRWVDDDLAKRLAPPKPLDGGVFGLDPALLHTSVEEMVWQRLLQEAQQRRAEASAESSKADEPAVDGP